MPLRQFHNGKLYNRPQAPLWRKPEKTRRLIVNAVCRRFIACFGTPRLDNPQLPTDDLVFLMLSNRTRPDMAKLVFSALKKTGSWDAVSRQPRKSLELKIRAAGLAKKRSQQIKSALQQISADFGSCNLDPLRNWTETAALRYLTDLPGVSVKVAKCVMMYTLGFNVLPVDVHVFRVSSRLGWTSRCRASECHDDLESLVSPIDRYGFHVGCIVLGREICTPRVPNCKACPIQNFCSYYVQHNEPTH
jgi:endonuclease-3